MAHLAVRVGSGRSPASRIGGVTTALYVSPTGDDTGIGTIGAPFRTLARARAEVRTLVATMAADITVYLRGGVYPVTATESWVTADSGLNGFTVVWRNYPGEIPRLSGGVTITGWSDQGGGIWRAATSLSFRQMYVNGTRAIRARTPNVGSYYTLASWNTGAETITMQTGTVASWGNLTQVEAVILGKGVNECHLRIASRSGDTITPQATERTRIFDQVYPPKETRPYFFENALEFLDQDGEFYLDTVNDFVYYNPRSGQDMTTAVVYVPQVERLLSIAGTSGDQIHDLQFYGLYFEHSTYLTPDTEGHIGDQASTIFLEVLPADEITSYPSGRLPAAVHVEYADDLRFERNVFRHCGASALNLYQGVTDAVVIGNVIHDCSGSGISVDLALLGNTANANIPCRRVTVSNNYLTQTGQDYYHSVGIMFGYVDEGIIEQNECTDMPYIGITVGWGWSYESNTMDTNIVRRNEVWNVCKLMSDSSGIYTLSDQNGGLIEHNYIHDIVRNSVAGAFNISDIYLDEGSGDITVQNNVCTGDGDTFVFQNANGSNVTLSNNDASDPGGVISGAGLTAPYADIVSLVE